MHSSQDLSQLPSKSTPSKALADKLAPWTILGRMLDLKSANNVLQLSKGDAKAQFFTKDYFVSYLHRSTLEEEKKQWMDSPFNNGNLNESVKKLKKYLALTKQTTISANTLLLLADDQAATLDARERYQELKNKDDLPPFETEVINKIKAVILSGNTSLLQIMLQGISNAYLLRVDFKEIFEFAAKFTSWEIAEVILSTILEAPVLDSYIYFRIYDSRQKYPQKIMSIIEDLDRFNYQSEQIQNWLADPIKVKILDNLMLIKQADSYLHSDSIKIHSNLYAYYKRLNLFGKLITTVFTAMAIAAIVSAIIFAMPLLFVFLPPMLGFIGYAEHTRRRLTKDITTFEAKDKQLADYTFIRLNKPDAHPINDLSIFSQLAKGCALLHSQGRLTGNIVQKLNQYCDLHPEYKSDKYVEAYLSASRRYPAPSVAQRSSYTQQSPVIGMLLLSQEFKRETPATSNDAMPVAQNNGQEQRQDSKREENPVTANNAVSTVQNNTQEEKKEKHSFSPRPASS